jgi:hypothetical protein
MNKLPRRVRKISESNSPPSANKPEPLETYRDSAAWVLLGEPGAGKSTALKMEADAVDGQYLRIDEFIHDEPDDDWQGKTLFLDGLDEVRAGGNQTQLGIRKQLKRLGNPPFRLACRAADWYGSSDRSALGREDITVLQLEPLSYEDKLALLGNPDFHIPDVQAFIEEARRRGIADLLDNPQTLELLAKAISDQHWPANRDETYRLACETLVEEANKEHRNKRRGQPLAVATRLDAAGQLCAVLLFADQTGIALDASHANERFFTIASVAPTTPDAAAQAVGSKLFIPDGEERVIPTHRSIAEYLAARWLAQRIDQGLPLKRVLNLLLGADGGVVAGLRGLFAWLALHSLKARPALIGADPLTTIVYGDVRPMSLEDKRELLHRLRREARSGTVFHRRETIGSNAFGALTEPELVGDYQGILDTPERDDAAQETAYCILEMLRNAPPLPDLEPSLLAVIRDDSRWLVVRNNALTIWLRQAEPAAAIALLDEINIATVQDGNDELSGRLLRYLYPTWLPPAQLWQYLHPRRNSHLIGSYLMFWESDLLELAPDEHLPTLIDGLVDHPIFQKLSDLDTTPQKMASALLCRALTCHGDRINDERLYNWLCVGLEKNTNFQRDHSDTQEIGHWLSERPDRYKAILALCYANADTLGSMYVNAKRHLHQALPPQDLGFWHLEQASFSTQPEIVSAHLSAALRTVYEYTESGELSLNDIIEWAELNTERRLLLEPMLSCEIPDWHFQSVAGKVSYQDQQNKNKLARTQAITPYLTEIRNGTALPGVMNELAGIWSKRFSNIRGETLEERFNSYADSGAELLIAARSGLYKCPDRDDLPSVEEIISLSIGNREHYIRMPCLIGMDLRWEENPSQIETITDETLRRMIAFRLTYGCDQTPRWFFHLAEHRPFLVADVLQKFAIAAFKSDRNYFEGISLLWHEPSCRALAKLTAPNLLAAFPVRARSEQLHHLETLLKTAFRDTLSSLPELVDKKLAMRGMDAAQKVYWMATATLLDPNKNELAMWRYVGTAEAKANILAAFLNQVTQTQNSSFQLPVSTMGRLIEVIAPHAQLIHPTGASWVSPAMDRGQEIRSWINRIAATPTVEAGEELERLLTRPSLHQLRIELEQARYEQKQQQREKHFCFLSLTKVAQIFANQAPTSLGDLLALTVDHLEEIGKTIRQDNDDGYRAFWNVEKGRKLSQREENLCRDALLTRLKAQLSPYGIVCTPEVDHSGDKRSDIQVSYRSDFSLPIEIKRDSHKDLWKAADNQLAKNYLKSAEACGIYLVLWFGDGKQTAAKDGGSKPRSAAELEQRLRMHLAPANRQRIHILVLDVSWPS